MLGRGAPRGSTGACCGAGTPRGALGGCVGGWVDRQGCRLVARLGAEPLGGTGSTTRDWGSPSCPGCCPCLALPDSALGSLSWRDGSLQHGVQGQGKGPPPHPHPHDSYDLGHRSSTVLLPIPLGSQRILLAVSGAGAGAGAGAGVGWAGTSLQPSQPCSWAVRPRARPVGAHPAPSLTQEQQRKTMQKDSMMPAIPTTQVRRRKRMTPKMFWRQGR